MRRRAFTLTELLIVIAIIAVLAAILFPVFARSKERAKHTACEARLRQFALALNLYRNDYDGKGFIWATYDGKGNRYPFNSYEPMASYLGSGQTVWCPEPTSDPMVARDFYHYSTWNDTISGDPRHTILRRPFTPDAGNVVVFCANHTTTDDLRPGFAPFLRIGTYPFIREDLSMGLADSRRMEVWFYDSAGWSTTSSPFSAAVLRFPGVPWPPTPEF
jgi:prepilin-type N-terminal cleavage/methylation domain-containing protein